MKKSAGFTLIELMVVIVIIAILASIAVINYIGTRDDAQDARIRQELGVLSNAVQKYEIDTGSLPATCGTNGDMASGGCLSVLMPNYLSHLPTKGPNGYVYRYFKKSDTKYGFYGQLKNPTSDDTATLSDATDLGYATQYGVNFKAGN